MNIFYFLSGIERSCNLGAESAQLGSVKAVCVYSNTRHCFRISQHFLPNRNPAHRFSSKEEQSGPKVSMYLLLMHSSVLCFKLQPHSCLPFFELPLLGRCLGVNSWSPLIFLRAPFMVLSLIK